MHYQLLSSDRWRSLHSFYKRNRYHGFPRRGDTVYVVMNDNKDVLAAARITQQAGEKILRGVWVDAQIRQTGVGTQLLTYIRRQGGLSNCFCFADISLSRFYMRIGFEIEELPPAKIAALYLRYSRDTPSVKVFYYPS